MTARIDIANGVQNINILILILKWLVFEAEMIFGTNNSEKTLAYFYFSSPYFCN